MVGLLTAICLKAETFPVGRKLFASRENSRPLWLSYVKSHTQAKFWHSLSLQKMLFFFCCHRFPQTRGLWPCKCWRWSPSRTDPPTHWCQLEWLWQSQLSHFYIPLPAKPNQESHFSLITAMTCVRLSQKNNRHFFIFFVNVVLAPSLVRNSPKMLVVLWHNVLHCKCVFSKSKLLFFFSVSLEWK